MSLLFDQSQNCATDAVLNVMFFSSPLCLAVVCTVKGSGKGRCEVGCRGGGVAFLQVVLMWISSK